MIHIVAGKHANDTKVEIDGIDITDKVTELKLEIQAGEFNKVTLSVLPDLIEVIGDIELEIAESKPAAPDTDWVDQMVERSIREQMSEKAKLKRSRNEALKAVREQIKQAAEEVAP